MTNIETSPEQPNQEPTIVQLPRGIFSEIEIDSASDEEGVQTALIELAEDRDILGIGLGGLEGRGMVTYIIQRNPIDTANRNTLNRINRISRGLTMDTGISHNIATFDHNDFSRIVDALRNPRRVVPENEMQAALLSLTEAMGYLDIQYSSFIQFTDEEEK